MALDGAIRNRGNSLGARIIKDFKRNKYKYLLFIPIIVYFIVFAYKPMYGIIIAFKNFRPNLGIMDSKWVGLDNFQRFFSDTFFLRILRNTFLISLFSILWGFPVPVIFALLLNEVGNRKFKKAIQTSSYLPHFISTVIVCSMISQFSYSDGLFNNIIELLGGQRSVILQNPGNFRTIYVASGIWQEFGWSSIIYIAAIAGIDQEQYEAAIIDGAGRFAQVRYITIPGIMTTLVMLFILRMGGILSVGAEKTLLLYSPVTYSTADVISTYTYRKGLIDGSFSYATAAGLFNSVINLIFLLATNFIAKKTSDVGLF